MTPNGRRSRLESCASMKAFACSNRGAKVMAIFRVWVVDFRGP
jgi:hypothetical protein